MIMSLFVCLFCFLIKDIFNRNGRRVTIVTNIQNDLFHPENSRISQENCRISVLFEVKNIPNFLLDSNRLIILNTVV